MKNFIINWQTSLAGLAVIGGGIFLTVSGQVTLGSTLIAAGLGLIASKQQNVTGGTKQQ